MFLFVQARESLKYLNCFDKLRRMIKDLPDCLHFYDKTSLVFSDLPFKRANESISLWILGHPNYPSEEDIDEALSENVWEHFGSRFKIITSTGKWSFETDPIGVFGPTFVALGEGVFFADGYRTLLKLDVVDYKENPDWLADMLISGFPHDSTSMLLPFERARANSFVKGAQGRIISKYESSFVSNLPGPLAPNESVEESRNAIDEILSSLPQDGIGIHLTGGYDSRLILASLLRVGIRPKCFIFGKGENYNSKIAKKLADTLQLHLSFLPLDSGFSNNFTDFFEEAIFLTEGVSSPSHTHYLYATKKIADEVDFLITGVGGGELHRGLLRENVAFPRILANVLRPQSKKMKVLAPGHLFFELFPDLEWMIQGRVEMLEGKWERERSKGGALDVLLRNIFGGYFRSLMMIENRCLATHYPYLESRTMKSLLRSPFGPLYGGNLHAGIVAKIKSQRALVAKYQPGPEPLLRIMTDKGFPPSYLSSPVKWPLIPLSVYLSRWRRANLKELDTSRWLRSVENNFGEQLPALVPETDTVVWKRWKNKSWDQTDNHLLSRILHIAQTRKHLQRNFH